MKPSGIRTRDWSWIFCPEGIDKGSGNTVGIGLGNAGGGIVEGRDTGGIGMGDTRALTGGGIVKGGNAGAGMEKGADVEIGC